MSVLEAAATRRDAKGYLQKYAPRDIKAVADAPRFFQGDEELQESTDAQEPANVAIMKLRVPQYLDKDTIWGIAKTLSQLQLLGLLSVVVLDCGMEESRSVFREQALRLCEAIDSFGKPGAKVLDNMFTKRSEEETSPQSFFADNMCPNNHQNLHRALQRGLIPVIPSLASLNEVSVPEPVDSNRVILSLTKHLTGMQFNSLRGSSDVHEVAIERPKKIASVERIIILDPLGGTPVAGRPGACHRFVNLEQEYDTLLKQLTSPEGCSQAAKDPTTALPTPHALNLKLAKQALSLLPPSSSALITTPFAAANTASSVPSLTLSEDDSRYSLGGMVATRKRQNPLLHNLLTDRPVHSSSLPVQRIQDGAHSSPYTVASTAATLVKRGMPLTIYPDPRTNPWTPPSPGSPRLRLTDRCIDLPRLVYLIEDSFQRKLDVQDYLDRVNENIAGIIIAGEYEGGAILTWERPEGLDSQAAYDSGRMVPYLDKFAVLKSRQGSGGVADVVFNAMVRDCFPGGVCWRSRKDNPVNKWYFERSAGTQKLSDCNWTMFWTTDGLTGHDTTSRDYKDVCRTVEPSWADNKHILD